MNIIILGPQGSGKGTQAELVAEKFDFFHLESGDFLRDIAKNDTRVDQIINKEGKLLSDEETFDLISGHLAVKLPKRDGVILDGFPRTVRQYELFSQWLSQKGRKIDLAVLLDVSDEESVRRLSARRLDRRSGKIYNLITNPLPPNTKEEDLIQREDDKPEAIKKRLKLYHEKTQPLINVLDGEGILVRVNGERPIEVIAEEIFQWIQRFI